jgi:ribosomal protein S18 acetylase RimI-like enzyme
MTQPPNGVPALAPIEPLDVPKHDRGPFASGEPALDEWLKKLAGQATRRDGARTYVACDGARVVGYYSLCAFQLERESAPEQAQFGALPVPAILLARLAVDREWQGSGLGRRLVVHAAATAVAVADLVGARVLVVHALHEVAAGFYRRLGFAPFETRPLSLYLTMKDIRETLVAAGLR